MLLEAEVSQACSRRLAIPNMPNKVTYIDHKQEKEHNGANEHDIYDRRTSGIVHVPGGMEGQSSRTG